MVDKKKIALETFVLMLNSVTLGNNSIQFYYEWEYLSAFRLLFSVIVFFILPPAILLSIYNLYLIFLDYEEERKHKNHRLQLKFVKETFE